MLANATKAESFSIQSSSKLNISTRSSQTLCRMQHAKTSLGKSSMLVYMSFPLSKHKAHSAITLALLNW